MNEIPYFFPLNRFIITFKTCLVHTIYVLCGMTNVSSMNNVNLTSTYKMIEIQIILSHELDIKEENKMPKSVNYRQGYQNVITLIGVFI